MAKPSNHGDDKTPDLFSQIPEPQQPDPAPQPAPDELPATEGAELSQPVEPVLAQPADQPLLVEPLLEYGSVEQEQAVEEFIGEAGLVPPAPPSYPTGMGMDDDGETAEVGLYAENAYLAYAMSVVKGRALPAAQDGQKPVQRRILFAMRQMGLQNNSKPVKSARVVGDVLGKYHPHGDSSAYEAAVRLAQGFTLRYPLIDGQGNFGSRDGDSAAAMRYTEMRLKPISELLLSEIDMGTVDFIANYDGAFQEPSLLPARLPILLMNGSTGVAVGMATNMPPHNIREVTEAAILAVKELSKSTLEPGSTAGEKRTQALFDEVMSILQGPDFPDGGHVISPRADILAAYDSGRGSLRVRCRWEVENLARGQYRIIITELPYDVPTTRVMMQIEDLSNPKIKKNKKSLDQDQLNTKQTLLSMLDLIRNESGEKVRIVIEPKTSKVKAEDLMNFLLAHTDLETSYSINMTMVGNDGKPKQKGIVDMLREWAAFRFDIVTRRSQFSLDKALARIHILDGRMIAFIHIEEIIKVIRESDDPKESLMQRFGLSEIQAEDILEIRLRQLARLEGIRIENEIKALREEADRLSELLANPGSMRSLIIKEMREDVKKYGDDRRTLIEPVMRVRLPAAAKTLDEPVTIILSRQGWIRARQGHDIDESLLTYKQTDSLHAIVRTRTVNPVVFLDSKGRSYTVPASSIPGGKGDGVPVITLIDIQDHAKLVHMLSAPADRHWLFASSNAYGFVAPLSALIAKNKAGKSFMSIDGNDKILPPIAMPEVEEAVYLSAQSSQNKGLVFPVSEMKFLPSGGKGVLIMDIPDGDTLIEIQLFADLSSLDVLGKKGKRLHLNAEKIQKHLAKRARKGQPYDA